MNTALVKASKTVKGITSTVRLHLDAVERAREIYLAHIKRAEAEYFDRIKRATAIVSGDGGQTPETAESTTISEAPQATSAAP